MVQGCPFCGSTPHVSTRASNETATGVVWFVTCYCGGYAARAWVMGDSEDVAAKQWNTRALPTLAREVHP